MLPRDLLKRSRLGRSTDARRSGRARPLHFLVFPPFLVFFSFRLLPSKGPAIGEITIAEPNRAEAKAKGGAAYIGIRVRGGA